MAEGTRTVSELRLSLRVQPRGMLAGLQGLRTVHLGHRGLSGEWLLDLGLMGKSYAAWSRDALERAARRPGWEAFGAMIASADGRAPLDESVARRLAEGWSGRWPRQRRRAIRLFAGAVPAAGDLADRRS